MQHREETRYIKIFFVHLALELCLRHYLVKFGSLISAVYNN